MRLKQKLAFAASHVVFAGTPWIQKSNGLEAQSAPTSADATNATNAANNQIKFPTAKRRSGRALEVPSLLSPLTENA
jgi:hypothetical protein